MFAIPQNIKIISVTKLNRFAKQVLESEIGQVWVSGEISNFTRAASGHWYFTLKDDKAQVRTAMFKGANQKVSFQPKHGDKIIVRANISLYEARGDYQLIAVSMEPEGVGKLKQAFEALKIKLQEQGLFDHTNKKPLPEKINKIGLVTSPTGAAVHDILHVLQRRNPAIEVIIYPSMVQGDTAAKSIAKQIEIANLRSEVDVLIVGRGGGSLEDLWPFNEEIVAQAIYASHLPTLSAVGHEVDVTIADFVADMRAATPSAAAEMLSEDSQELINRLNQRKIMLMRALTAKLGNKSEYSQQLTQRLLVQHPQKKLQQNQQSFDYLNARLIQQHPIKKIKELNQEQNYLNQRLFAQHPATSIKNQLNTTEQLSQRMHKSMQKIIQQHKQENAYVVSSIKKLSPLSKIIQLKRSIDDTQTDLAQAYQAYISNRKQALASSSALLNSVSPLSTLSRGYSITMKQDKLVDSVNKVKDSDIIITRLKDGEIKSRVIKRAIENKE